MFLFASRKKTQTDCGVNTCPLCFASGMNTLIGYDLVPEPKILEAALRACRRLNDLASAIRVLEAVKVNKTLRTIAEYTTVTLFNSCLEAA